MPGAVVVAGGYSRRFGGREKALARVDGSPMLERVVRALAPAVDEVVINCREPQRPAFERALSRIDAETRFAVDPAPDLGPAAGLERGLSAATADTVAVAACDLPLLVPAVPRLLFERHAADCEATVPRRDGYDRPLCAVYEVEPALAACRAAREASGPSLRAVLDRLETRTVTEDRIADLVDPRRLDAVDEPSGVSRAERLARSS